MAENEVHSEGEALTFVFDPNTDFRNFASLDSSILSPEISFLVNLNIISSRQQKKYLYINSSRTNNDYYTFEEDHYKQLVSYIFHPKTEVTNSTLAEVHGLNLSPHCLSRALPSQHNITTQILREISLQNLLQETRYSEFKDIFNFKSGNDGAMERSLLDSKDSHPTIHSFVKNQATTSERKSIDSNDSPSESTMNANSKSQLILVPQENRSGHQQEVIQEVFRYPPGSIEMVVERSGGSSVTGRQPRKDKRKNSNKKKFHASQSSLSSSNSAVSCKSVSSLASQTDSVISRGSSNKSLILNDCEKVGNHSSHNGKVAFFHKTHERDGSDAMSDSSSNLSTMSDLSGYEDEYVMIKKLISDRPNKVYEKRIVSDSIRKRTYLETKVLEQESTIKSLNTLKEDLEIQVHRLSVQLQNSVREKEVCQEQLDIMQTKLAEKRQQEYFELMKDKLSIEGQNEALKQELQHYSTANGDLEMKFRQIKIDIETSEKDRLKLSNLNTELKNSLANMEHQNIKLKNDLNALSETLMLEHNVSCNLKSELDVKNSTNKELEIKIETYKQESENYQDTICNLKKWNMEYSEREEQHRIEKKKLENLISESSDKYNSLKESSEWYHLQLKKTHEQLSELQNELTEAKSSLSVVSGDRDRCKREVERLNVEIEDNRVKAMRDKSLLLVQLEELEADMKERELVIRRLEEGDKVSHVKLSEDRFRRLEEDHKKLHEMKIEMRDILRHSDSLKEELKRKSFVAKKSEDAIRDLRKDLVVSQEELSSKDICIEVLKEKVSEAKSKLEKAYDKLKENESSVARLKEHNLQLEASSLTAEQDKKQVDETIARLKEDMSKLSSNFFRMKHDLSAKDKQIDVLSEQNKKTVLTEKEMALKIEKMEVQMLDDEKGKLLHDEINSLKEMLANSTNEMNSIKTEAAHVKKCLESAELEKNSVINSLNLRDEQIDNMKGVIDTYKEKILQKDEELFTRKDQVSKFERNFDDLQKRFNRLNNEYQLHLQEKEEFQQLEINYRNTIAELKENMKMEKRTKENWDKKFKDKLQELADIKEQLEEKVKTNEHLKGVITRMEKELEKLKEKDGIISALKDDINLRSEKLTKQENEIQCLTLHVGEINKSFVNKESENEETIKLKNNEIIKLQESLNSKNSEIKKLELTVAETKQKRENGEINSRLPPRVDRNTVRQNFKKGKSLKNFREEKIEIDSMKQKLKEATDIMANKDKELNDLHIVSSNYERQKDLVNKVQTELEDMKKQCHFLTSENVTLNDRCSSLQSDLQTMNANYVMKGEECNKWRVMFENLNDTIPQRDTDPYQAESTDQLASPRSSYHEFIPPLHTHERGRMNHEEEGVLQNFNLEEGVKFSQTMVYLQNQITLTAETLKNKDKQILELNKQLSNLSANSTAIGVHTTIPSLQLSHLSSDRQTSNVLQVSDKATSVDGDLQSTNDTIKERETEIFKLHETLTVKDSDFKEKKRRYESNLRLLTRKLKEHMKGRRTAEKELEVVTQENKKNLDEDEKRYNVLKNKYIDLEKKSQHLESEIASNRLACKEKEAAISVLENDIEKERNLVLEMQKEIGQKEQLKLCLDNLRSEINSLNFELVEKNTKLEELKDNLDFSLKERQILEEKCHSLSLQVAELGQRMEKEVNKVTEKEKLVNCKEDKIIKSYEDICRLKETLSAMQLKCDRLEASLDRVQIQDGNKEKKISLLNEDLEGLKSCIDIKNALIQDYNVKMTILEKEIQIKQGTIDSLKSEVTEVKKESSERQEKHQASVVILNKRISEAIEMESSLNARLAGLHKEKMSLQSQCTQLKMALNSALEKLRGSSSNLPSPSPLNTEALAKLMEQSSKPAQTNKFMVSLSERLHSLREEVSVLQTEIKTRDQIQ